MHHFYCFLHLPKIQTDQNTFTSVTRDALHSPQRNSLSPSVLLTTVQSRRRILSTRRHRQILGGQARIAVATITSCSSHSSTIYHRRRLAEKNLLAAKLGLGISHTATSTFSGTKDLKAATSSMGTLYGGVLGCCISHMMQRDFVWRHAYVLQAVVVVG